MTVLTVVRPGLLTTVQDGGRWGYQDRGVPVAGPMDPVAHRVANALVGNARDAATLEVTLTGPEVECTGSCTMAVAGAAFEVTVDGLAVPTQERLEVPAGARVRFARRLKGCRAYMSVAGGIDVPLVLGSRATHLLSRMGGLSGRPLRAGDRLPVGPEGGHGGVRRTLVGLADGGTSPARLRVVLGPQADWFAPDAIERLTSSVFRVASESDRTGFRLSGPVLEYARPRDLISEATPIGSLQVPASGQPILLMADRQTAGGYPKIATVVSADLPVAGQLAPGDVLRFELCSMEAAMAALAAQERRLLELESEAAR
jgi:antagonist of KipI